MNRLESRRGWCVYGRGVKAAVSRFDSARKNCGVRLRGITARRSDLLKNATVLRVHPDGIVEQYLWTRRGE